MNSFSVLFYFVSWWLIVVVGLCFECLLFIMFVGFLFCGWFCVLHWFG